MSLPAVSKHLKVLERAGLITRGREAQWRPCRLEAAPLKDVADWLEHYRRFWDESFDRLDDYLRELQTTGRTAWPQELARGARRPSASSSSRASSMRRASLVFKAWTEPEHLVRWWGPKGFTTPSCQMDVRPGRRLPH